MAEKTFKRKKKGGAAATERSPPVVAESPGRIGTDLGVGYSARPAYALAAGPTAQAPFRQREAEEEPVRTRREIEAQMATRGIANPGPGQPLHPAARDALESRLGQDLRDVRVHSDPPAQRAARDFGARAFTQGRHIWLGPGESSGNLGLMAHEATHVVQQARSSAVPAVQMAGPGACPDSAGGPELNGTVISIPEINLPSFRDKSKIAKPLTKIEDRGAQRDTWIEGVNAKLQGSVEKKLKDVPPVPQSGGSFYYFEVGNTGSFLFGSKDQIVANTAIPYWDETGNKQAFDVDHMQELQTGGADEYENMELLSASSNRSSGSKIKNELRKRVKKAAECLEERGEVANLPKEPPALVGQGYGLEFKEIQKNLKVKGDGEPHWDRSDIETGAHLEHLKPLPTPEIDKLRKDDTKLRLFQTPGGGAPAEIPWKKEEGQASFTSKSFVPGFAPSKVVFDVDSGSGTITGKYPASARKRGGKIISPEEKTWNLVGLPGLHYAAYVDQSSILSTLKILKAKGLSAVEIHEAYVDPGRGVVASGVIKPSLNLFAGKNVSIDLTIDQGDVTFSKTFVTDDFSIPGPVKLTQSSLTVSAGTGGLAAEGQVDFEIEGVAEGHIGAKGAVGESLQLEGEINFDSDLFKPAVVNVWYRERLGGEGKLGIGAGAVKGIKSGLLTVSVDGDKWEATGTVDTDVPGVKKGELSAKFDKGKGFEIGGKLEFDENIPAISGGSIEAKVLKGEGGYKLKASGNATLDIPGAKTTIEAEYDDGGVLIKGTVGYKTKLVSGSVTAGASNMPVDKEGNPAGPPADGALTAFGCGAVTLQFAPWLQGKMGLELTPTGEVKVSGEVGLPGALEVFPEKQVEKEILSIGIDIPIVGVAVAGQRIGIFATVSGSLSAGAGIGPGKLEELSLGVDYNPMREEDTKVSGKATFVVPAHAGLKLAVRGGVGAGIPIVSAQVGLEVAGELGIDGKAEASAQIDWTPAKGIELKAKGKISAEPKFEFSISGYAAVEADLFVGTVDLYSQTWEFGAMEFGSGLKFGITFPVHYKDGEPFDISLDDVEFTVPDIDTTALLKNLIKQIT